MNIASRNTSYPGDLALLLPALRRFRAPARITDYPSPADLHELLCLPERQADTRLWLDETGNVVAFAIVDAYQNLLFEIDPGISDPQLHEEIFSWVENCLLRRPLPPGTPRTLDAPCRLEDASRLAILEAFGFVRQTEETLEMERSLTLLTPEPELPTGFSIRPFHPEKDVDEWVSLHRAAFGTQYMTRTERQTMMASPEYDPALDLVAVAPNGRLAAYCMCRIEPEAEATHHTIGYTDPVATHPDFQRRGLARALILTGMRLLKARGVETARMGTSSTNQRMQCVARGVGFEVVSRKAWFSKEV